MYLSYKEYIDFHIEQYGRKPKAGILKKYYPDEFREEDAEPEEERLQFFTPPHVDMLFGHESED